MPRKKQTKSKAKKWDQRHEAAKHLIEEELEGLVQYLRSIHYLSVLLIIASLATMLYGIHSVFQNSMHAVVGFLGIILTSLGVAILSAFALRPWILPRFLLPIDLQKLSLPQLLELFDDPEEYLRLIKNHTQIITDQYLVPKLRRLRNAVILFIFGFSISLLLAIALP